MGLGMGGSSASSTSFNQSGVLEMFRLGIAAAWRIGANFGVGGFAAD
jgi:hypothetical protein